LLLGTKKMKVLNVNSSQDPVWGGGTGTRTHKMSLTLVNAGITVTVLTTDRGMTPEQQQSYTNIRLIALPTLNARFFVPRFSLSQISRLVKEADIIHLMGHWSFLNALVWVMAKRHKKPYVVCPAGALIIFGRSKILKYLYNLIIGKRIIKQAAGHIAITNIEISHFASYGVPKEDIILIPNAIDEADYQITPAGEKAFRGRCGLGQNSFILFIGRLNSIKGPDLLLSAYGQAKGQLADYHLVFAGPDEGMKSQLEEAAANLNITNKVHFIGYLDQQAKAQALKAAVLLAIPSRHEAMSIVVLEAGINGTPVLITDQCGFNEIKDINAGVVVGVSASELKTGLLTILADRESLIKHGHNLQTYVRSHYTWRIMVNKYLNLYDNILNKVK